ncbi:unnamed protein product [Arctogadus glacialis]
MLYSRLYNNGACNGGPHEFPTWIIKVTLTLTLGSVLLAEQRVEERTLPPEGGRPTTPALDLRVVDSYGTWASLWESQFAALNIPHLRSHTLVHTDPFNKKALQDFTVRQGRTAELQSLPDLGFILDENAYFSDSRLGRKEQRRLRMPSSLKRNLSVCLPGTRLSVDFFKEQVERYGLDRVLLEGTVDSITPVMMEQEEEVEEEEKEVEEVEEKEGEEKEVEEEEVQEKEVEEKEVEKQEVVEEKEVGARDSERDGEGVRKRRVKYFRVLLQGGVTVEARQVVLATGPTRAQMANIPGWVEGISEDYPEERLQHSVSLMHHLASARHAGLSPDVGRVCDAGQRLMVVGGGLTSAHIVSIALEQGASHVTWVMRKHLQLKQFDVGDVEGLVGRYSHVEHGIKLDGRAHLSQFYGEKSLQRRLAMIRQARKGGAVSPEAYVQLKPYIQSGRVDLKTYRQVSEARWCYRRQVWSVALCDGSGWTGDRVWLATGCKLDARHDPLLSGVMKEYPIQVMEGWPCVTPALQWAPGCPLYVMGQYAALQVGPHAVNLAGGQAASLRIAADIMRRRARLNGVESNTQLHSYAPLLESYVQQMHGLMWL